MGTARAGHLLHVPGDADRAPTFEEVYEAHFGFVWRTVRALGVPPPNLDDAVQDVFVVVHRGLARFDRSAAITSWLFGIARRVAKDYRRRHARKGRGVPLSDTLPDSRPDPQEVASRAEAARQLLALLDELDDERRAVLVLVDVEGFSVPEAAEALSVNVNTVYSRLRLARQDLEAARRRSRAR